ncbi:MAG: alpha/beta hydrolase, partial [Burkholderiaceae bacterium]
MNAHTQRFSILGGAGQIECALDLPEDIAPRGVVLVAHPHPLYGGTMDNKVAQTLARAFVALGYAAARMNFRGVGASAGSHDEGRGETDDMAL